MEKIKINLNKISRKEIGLIVDFLKRGKVIVYPTDTVYGLGCSAVNKRAIKKIFAIKKREKRKPMIILVSSLGMLNKYCFVSKRQNDILKKYWPAPITFILKSRNILPKELTGGTDSIAARLPKKLFLIKIKKKTGVPIVSTSANISGEKNLDNVKSIEKYFKKNKLDLAVNGGILKGRPSRVVDLRDIGNIKILRK